MDGRIQGYCLVITAFVSMNLLKTISTKKIIRGLNETAKSLQRTEKLKVALI